MREAQRLGEEWREAVDQVRLGKPRLFMERYLKIRYADTTLGRLSFTPEQEYYYKESFGGLRDYYQGMVRLTLKHRDAYSTTFWAGVAFTYVFCQPGFICAFVIDSEQKHKDVIVPMFDLFEENMPAWVAREKGHWDTELREYVFRGADGSMMRSAITFSSSRSKNIGRAGRPKMVIYSEESAYEGEMASEMQVGMIGSMPEGTWEIHESTPKGTRNTFYSVFKSISDGFTAGKVLFRRWFDRKDHHLRPEHEWVRPVDRKELKETGTLRFTAEEIVLSSEFPNDEIPDLWRILWRRARIQKFVDASYGDADRGKGAFLQEEPENPTDCWYNVANPSLPRERLRQIINLCRPPLDYQEPYPPEPGVKIERWELPVLGHQYVAGFDPAEGVTAGDLLAFQIIDANTGRHVLQMFGNANVTRFTKRCVELCHEYNTALLVIERNGNGVAAVEAAKNAGYWKLYRPVNKALQGQPDTSTPYGFHTNIATRPLMHEAAWNGLFDGTLTTSSASLAQDMLDYNPDEDHLPDRFAAFMLAAVVLRERGMALSGTGGIGGLRVIQTVPYG